MWGGATEWLDSQPLGRAELHRGLVVMAGLCGAVALS
jgi:hypothetical protein